MPEKNRGADGDGKLQEKTTVPKKVLVPDAVDKGGSIPSPLTMDSTSHQEDAAPISINHHHLY